MSDDTKALVERAREVAGYKYQHHTIHVPVVLDMLADTIERLERDRDALAERCEKLDRALRDFIEDTCVRGGLIVAPSAGTVDRASAALAAPKDAPNESRCTHKSSKIMRGIDNTYDVAWCDDCGAITWASDDCLTDEELHRSDREKWCESRVLAWGCAREADGANACKWWCGHPETCAVTLRADREMAEKEGK